MSFVFLFSFRPGKPDIGLLRALIYIVGILLIAYGATLYVDKGETKLRPRARSHQIVYFGLFTFALAQVPALLISAGTPSPN